MSEIRKPQKIQPDWWSKSLAAILLGALLSYGLIGLFAWLGPDNLQQPLSNERALWRVQFNMWMISPVWLLIIAFTYMFQSGKKAWIKLGLANVLVYALLIGLKAVV